MTLTTIFSYQQRHIFPFLKSKNRSKSVIKNNRGPWGAPRKKSQNFQPQKDDLMQFAITICIIAGIIDIAYVGSQKFVSLEAGLNEVKNKVSKIDNKIDRFNDKIDRFLTDINQKIC